MSEQIKIIECEEVGDRIFFLPQVYPVVMLAPGDTEPTLQQEQNAVLEAYTQAARRGEVGVMRLTNE